MSRDVIQRSLIQQMMGGSPNWWNINNLRLPSAEQASPPVPTSSPPSSSSSSVFPQYPQPSQFLPIPSCHDNQELPDQSWIQLVMGGLVGEEDKSSFMVNPCFQHKKVENWEDQILSPSSNALKHESTEGGYLHSHGIEDVQASRPSWSQIMQGSSPRSCITSFNSSMLDFSNRSTERRNQQADHSSECNSTATGAPFKKARVQASSPQSTNFKVRKEKLGDRIAALHQIVSPFGKTDTASVLLEAIGYIRFLQSQIEALSSPYMGSAGSERMRQPVKSERSCIFPEDPGQLLNAASMKKRGASDQEGNDESKRDLRSRGLCLVPLSCIMHVGSSNGADYWAPTLGGGFR